MLPSSVQNENLLLSASLAELRIYCSLFKFTSNTLKCISLSIFVSSFFKPGLYNFTKRFDVNSVRAVTIIHLRRRRRRRREIERVEISIGYFCSNIKEHLFDIRWTKLSNDKLETSVFFNARHMKWMKIV